MTVTKLPRILLVDDNAAQRKLNALRLVGAGFEVETSCGVEDALQKMGNHPPDAVLSDVLMDDMDGFELCIRVRENPTLAAIPIVLISSHFERHEDQTLATSVGAHALVQRTPDFEDEVSALRASLAHGPRVAPRICRKSLHDEHLRSVTRQLSVLVDQVASSQARYKSLLDNANDAIAIIDEEGVVVEANRRWETMLDLPRGGLQGLHIDDLQRLPVEHLAPAAPATSSPVQDERARPGSAPLRVPIRGSAGETRLMEFTTAAVEVDGQRQAVTIGRDVTEATRAASALAASEERYRRLIERLPDVVWSASMDGDFAFVSPHVHGLTGFASAEVMASGHDWWFERIHPDDRPRAAKTWQDFVVGTTRSYEVEYRWQRRDGQWIWIHSRSSATYEQDGVLRCDGLFTETTQQRVLEESLRQAQKMEAVGQLAGGVAHDFNNMLSVIIANAEFLMRDPTANEQSRADATEIARVAQCASALTRQLLAFSRKEIVAPERFGVNGAVASLQKMLPRLISEDVELTIETDASAGFVRLDRSQFEQILLNLAVNARDAMPDGGRLRVTTGSVEIPSGWTGSRTGEIPAGPYVTLAVTDTGHGIPPGVLPRIFEPFFTTKGPGRGTGLGLSTVYGIVISAGGAIAVDSAPERGTTFTIYLPRAGIEAAGKTRDSADRPLEVASGTILLVEDEEMVRSVCKRILVSAGYEVVEAHNGSEALGLLENGRVEPALVLTDVVMPSTSGPDLVGTLIRVYPELKVLFMTGYTEHPALCKSMLEEKASLIRKPFSPAKLLQKVRDVLKA